MSRAFRRFFVLAVFLGFVSQGTGQDKDKRTWNVKPDPMPMAFTVADKGGLVLDLGKDGRNVGMRFPTTPSPFVVGSLRDKSFLFDLRTVKPVLTFPQPPRSAPAILALSPDGEYVAFGATTFGGGGDPLSVEVWSCKTGKPVAGVVPDKGVTLEWADFGPPGKLLVSLRKPIDEKSNKRELEIRDLSKGGAVIKTLTQPAFRSPVQPHVYALTPNRRYVIMPVLTKTATKFQLRVFDLETGEYAGQTAIFAPNGTLRELAVSHDGKRLAAMATDVQMTFHVFDMNTGDHSFSKSVPSGALKFDWAASYGHYSFGWMPDAKHVFVRPANVWNVETGEMFATKTWPGSIAATTPGGQIILRAPLALVLQR